MRKAIIDYTNYRGERKKRVIMPCGIQFALDDDRYHPRQWVLVAWEDAKQDYRYFALANIHSFVEI